MEALPAGNTSLIISLRRNWLGMLDRRHLWPERYDLRVWNTHVKDELERLLAQLVCQGRLDLATAQRDIAANWIDAPALTVVIPLIAADCRRSEAPQSPGCPRSSTT
jgi:hypothetical protein